MKEDNIIINADDVNVVEIINQIRENIKKRNYGNESFPELKELSDIDYTAEKYTESDYDLTKLYNEVTNNNRNWHIKTYLPIKSHRKLVGPVIVFAKKIIRKITIWQSNAIVDQQNGFNASITRSINELSTGLTKLVTENQELKKEICKLEEKLKDVLKTKNNSYELESGTEIVENIEEDNLEIFKEEHVKDRTRLLEKIKLLEERVNENRESVINGYNNKLDELEKEMLEFDKKHSRLEVMQREIIQVKEEHHRENVFINERMRRIERKLRNRNINNNDIIDGYINSFLDTENSNNNYNKEDINTKLDYFLFEQRYRGTREEIKERQKVYLNYYKGKNNILDIGCGRGEFIELLLEDGIDVKGIEINEDMVEFCKDRGLPVQLVNAFEYLENIEDNSLGGIFLGQVIEHIESKDLIRLIEICRNKLQPLGVFIAETPNPQCLSIFANSFYMDLSHEKPVHPLTMKFLMESSGYSNIEIKYLSPADNTLEIPKIEANDNVKNINEFNKAWEKIHNTIYGYQDYAIIARR